jgi:hypothetical protein
MVDCLLVLVLFLGSLPVGRAVGTLEPLVDQLLNKVTHSELFDDVSFKVPSGKLDLKEHSSKDHHEEEGPDHHLEDTSHK